MHSAQWVRPQNQKQNHSRAENYMTLANMNVHLNRLIGSSLQRLTASVHGVCVHRTNCYGLWSFVLFSWFRLLIGVWFESEFETQFFGHAEASARHTISPGKNASIPAMWNPQHNACAVACDANTPKQFATITNNLVFQVIGMYRSFQSILNKFIVR